MKRSRSPLAATLSPLKSFGIWRNKSSAGGANHKEDYLFQAAQFISAAQKAEAESAFELAFSCYKSAVTMLLQGGPCKNIFNIL